MFNLSENIHFEEILENAMLVKFQKIISQNNIHTCKDEILNIVKNKNIIFDISTCEDFSPHLLKLILISEKQLLSENLFCGLILNNRIKTFFKNMMFSKNMILTDTKEDMINLLQGKYHEK